MVIFGQEITPKRLLLIVCVVAWIALMFYNYPALAANPKWIDAALPVILVANGFVSGMMVLMGVVVVGFPCMLIASMWEAAGRPVSPAPMEKPTPNVAPVDPPTVTTDCERKMDI